MKPRVSILIAARNAAEHLAATIKSVQRQSLREWQCLIVDDHSTDATAELAQAFAAQDSRIQLLRNDVAQNAETLASLVAARNLALEHAEADWIAIHDADDLMHRRRLERQLHHAEQHQLDVVGCGVRYFPQKHLGPGMARYQDWLNHQQADGYLLERFIEMPLAHPSMMIRNSMMQKVGGYHDNNWPEDYDLYLRLAAAGAQIGKVDDRLLAWRLRQDSTSRNHPCYSLAAFARCRAHHLAADFLAPSPNYVLWGYGDTGRELARNLKQLGRQPSAILELHPGRIGQRILDAPVHSPDEFFAQTDPKATLPIVVSVSGPGPRQLIRKYFREQQSSYREGRDFIFAA